MTLKENVTWAAVIVQGIAACLWVASTLAKVSADKVVADHQKQQDSDFLPSQHVNSDGSDIVETMNRQAYWNRWAALATAIGVTIQAIATAL